MSKKILVTVAFAIGVAAPHAIAAQPEELRMVAQMQQFMQVMEGYFDLIHAVHAINADPEKAAILQMQKIQEIHKERGDGAEAVSVLRHVMSNAKSRTLKNAAAVLLADTLKESGRASEALEVLTEALQANIEK